MVVDDGSNDCGIPELNASRAKNIRHDKRMKIGAAIRSGIKLLKKNIDITKAKEVFKIAKEEGISPFAYFMIGSPTETREEILNTINFAVQINPAYAQITITTPIPETEMYKDMLSKKYFTDDYWQKFAENPTKEFKTRYCEDTLSKQELFELMNIFYKKFYFRPKFIIKELLEIKSFSELKKKIKAGLKILS